MSYIRPISPRRHGITFATLAAGPIFSIALAIGYWLDDPAAAWDPASVMSAAWALALLPLTAIFGSFLAIVPNLVGSGAMTWLGRRNFAMQLPIAWLLVAAIAGGGFAARIGGDAPVVFAMSCTGGLCALLCRRSAHWDR